VGGGKLSGGYELNECYGDFATARPAKSVRIIVQSHRLIAMTGKVWTKAFSIIAEIAACVCLYFAAVTLLMIPRYPGESYLNWFRIVYGLVPALLCVSLPALAGWLWSRSGGPASVETYIQRALLGVVGAVALFFTCLVVVGRVKGWIP
jgi:hypothetical protein